MASYIDTNSSKLPNLAELLRTHRLLLFIQRDDALEIARKERVRISAQQQQAESHLQQLENRLDANQRAFQQQLENRLNAQQQAMQQQLENRLNAQQQAMQQLETALMPTNEQSNDNSRVSIYK
jgi:Skp family chaperone for outer membrane proteins